MVDREVLDEMRTVLFELQSLLQAEGLYAEYAYLFRRCWELLDRTGTEATAAQALKEYLLGIPNAPGTVHDLVIWRESAAERKRMNERLHALRERLFALARNL
ncbi:MAG: hypothetical protein AB2385_01905 [Symbiobacterium sp.]|uniref:hypothetical protein n=1 Tax=Symbiobacterium sp. TaxID=1971213 RepID=UPI003463B194